MKKPSKRNVERAQAIRKKRAELKKGGPLTAKEIEDLERTMFLVNRLNQNRGRASKWARGGNR